jgi:AmpD protein
VIHAISLPPQEFGGTYIDALFMNQLQATDHPGLADLADLRVSTHFLIERGGQVVQYVPVTSRAWHAGASSFGGVSACNHRSLGIELEGADTCPFAPAQYATLITLCADLCRAFPFITVARIVGHADIAPGRKTDPGPYFDWVGFRAALLRRVLAPRDDSISPRPLG